MWRSHAGIGALIGTFCCLACGEAGPGASDGAAGGAGKSAASGSGGAPAGGTAGVGGSATVSGGTTSSGGSTVAGTGGSVAGSSNDGGTGGSAAAGSGNGGGPPHVVANCDDLGEKDQWEEITPSAATNGLLHVVADPVNAGTVYFGGANQGIFKSTDCGATFVKINTGRNAGVMDSGGEWTLEIDPMEPNVLYAGSLYGSDPSLQKSTNGGVDWDSVFPPGSEVANTVDGNFFQAVSIDPTNHQHLVASFHANCQGEHGPMCMAETTDSGDTWRLFKGPLGNWGEGGHPLTLDGTSFLYATWADGLYYTSDNGEHWENVASGGEQLYRATDGTYYLGAAWGLSRSTDGHEWTKVDGAPGGNGLVGDGTRLFTGYRYLPPDSQQPYFTSPENDGTTWSSLPSPDMATGPTSLAYDADHHILYSSNWEAGAWRMVTE